MKRNRTLTVLAVAVALLCLSCFDSGAGSGTLNVSWRISGKTCTSAGVEDVRLTLSQDGEAVALPDVVPVPCSAGALVVEDLAAGTYDLLLEGLDKDGKAIYEVTATVKVNGGGRTTETPVLLLARKTGAVKLRWTFPPEAQTCGFSGIVSVEVTIEDTVSGAQRFNGLFPCDPATATEELPAPLVDGWIRVAGLPLEETVGVYLFGLNSQAKRSHFGEGQAKVVEEPEAELSIGLAACDGNCL